MNSSASRFAGAESSCRKGWTSCSKVQRCGTQSCGCCFSFACQGPSLGPRPQPHPCLRGNTHGQEQRLRSIRNRCCELQANYGNEGFVITTLWTLRLILEGRGRASGSTHRYGVKRFAHHLTSAMPGWLSSSSGCHSPPLRPAYKSASSSRSVRQQLAKPAPSPND